MPWGDSGIYGGCCTGLKHRIFAQNCRQRGRFVKMMIIRSQFPWLLLVIIILENDDHKKSPNSQLHGFLWSSFSYYILLAQGPSGPDLAPRTRKVPARRSPESSEPMLFETWNHLEPLETPWSLIWGLFATLAFFAILATFCQFGDFGNFLAIFLAHFDPWTICDNSLQ